MYAADRDNIEIMSAREARDAIPVRTPANEPTIATIASKTNEILAMLKEMLMCLDDMQINMYGAPSAPTDKIPEPQCVAGALDVIEIETREAMYKLTEIRKRMY